jgi:hypothetical protein
MRPIGLHLHTGGVRAGARGSVDEWARGEDADRGVRLVRAGRSRLSSGDRALLDAWPTTGRMPPARNISNGGRRRTAAYPEPREVWYWLGDAYYHNGVSLGLDDPFGLAEQAFQRGWALDSANAYRFSDSRALAHLRGAAGSHGGDRADEERHRVGATARRGLRAGGDSTSPGSLVPALASRARAGRLGPARLLGPIRHASIRKCSWRSVSSFSATGYGSQDYLRASELATRNFENRRPGEIAGSHATVLLNGGQPREVRRILHPDGISTDGLVARLLDGLFWQQDTGRDGGGGPVAGLARRGRPSPRRGGPRTTSGALYSGHVGCGT